MSNVIEREIVAAVELCRPDGTLNPAAIGWSRRPLLRTRLPRGLGAWGRNKRWEYWGITTPTHVVALTVSSLDYAALHQVWLLDRVRRTAIDEVAIVPFAAGVELPESLGDGPTRARGRRLSITIDADERGAVLTARTPRVAVDLQIDRPPGHECLAVVVPWSARRYQYTVKDLALPASGRLVVDGEEIIVPAGDSWAVLDHGRGRWPYAMTWNWGVGSGRVAGQIVGLQVGGKWTDGTGSTENALFVAGQAHKLGEALVWDYDRRDFTAPWRVRGERADLSFEPYYERAARTDLGLLFNETHQCFGTWSGWVADDHGQRVRVDGLEGWAEEVRNRW
ncbi:DUF2804 domain-containing protein [Nannocystis pusilla]|uniref:DUF2804 domain-containing protein n=1 Tax=Nannocystis pusilla TaxID=889268 RepID=A0ABS7TUF5_9BACT|nr:DUF2804 domain-containing protein [Nannocystis pusilla]MBZ5711882.1 DUF2804 domain-containing protein [Nannocystis pusilla]